MLLQDAIALAQEMIVTRCQNPNYDRVCELADEYKALMTGENAELLLTQFVKREDDEAFQQRLNLTILITPAVISALMNPFNKVSWNKKVKKSYDFGTGLRNETVDKMAQSFYGRKKSKNKGLDYWLKVRYPVLSFQDPNAWVVIEWDTPASQAEVIKPRPFEILSHMAWDWLVINEETKWLWVHQDILVNKLVKVTGQRKADRIAEGTYEPTAGDQWTLYDEDYTLVYTEVDPEYLQSINYAKASNETYWKDQATKKTYSVKTFKPNLTFVPAFRVGWMKDPQTNGQTFVNGWHTAKPYLMKSVKAVSEMDLTMSLHTFPQKMQYVQRCPGVEKKGCNAGYTTLGERCSACKGSGVRIHTSAQDALLYPFPDAGTMNAELLDLEKLLVYKAPPVELLNFQATYIEGLKTSCYSAVFNQTQITKVNKSGSSGTAGSAPITATEVGVNSDSVNQALHPFSEKVSDLWIDMIATFGILAGTPVDEEVDIACVFPYNPNIKTVDELLDDLQKAYASGAPSFVIDKINNDIAEVLYDGDSVAELQYQTKHQFYPFNGQTPDQIALAMASSYVSKFTKVLYSNYDAIFADIDLENVGFWWMTYEEQWPIVEDMVNEYITEIESDMVPALQITTPPGFPDINKDPNADPNQADDGEQVLQPGDPGYIEPAPAPQPQPNAN